MPEKLNLSGIRFSNLIAVREFNRDRIGFVIWECHCDCGKTTYARSASLKRGEVKSCGCLKAENNKSHGNSHLREYKIWGAIKRRCGNKNDKKYHLYGGRGISVCERWLSSFELFLSDMGYRPSKNHSIDRINVNGNYEPSNCKWATVKEQNRNKRTNRIIEYNGMAKTAVDWSEEFNMTKSKFMWRINNGWSMQRIEGQA